MPYIIIKRGAKVSHPRSEQDDNPHREGTISLSNERLDKQKYLGQKQVDTTVPGDNARPNIENQCDEDIKVKAEKQGAT